MKKFVKSLMEMGIMSLEGTSRCLSRDIDRIIFIVLWGILCLCFPDMDFYIVRGIIVVMACIFTGLCIKKEYEDYKSKKTKNKSEKNKIYYKIRGLSKLIEEIVFWVVLILLCQYFLSIDSDTSKYISRGIGIIVILIFVGIYLKKEYEQYKDEMHQVSMEKSNAYRQITRLYKLKKDKDSHDNFASPKQAEIEKDKEMKKN